MLVQEGSVLAIPEHIENAAHMIAGEVGVAHLAELIQMLTIIYEGRSARVAGQ